MADRFDRSIKVRQSTIDDIKKMGMAKAIERANSSDDKEFVEGARRFYGGNKVKGGGSSESQAKNAVQKAKTTGTAQPVKNLGGGPSPTAKSSAPTPAPVSQDAVARRLQNTKEAAASHPFEKAKQEREARQQAAKANKKKSAWEMAAKK